MEFDSFGLIAVCHDDFGLDYDVQMHASNCLLNQQSLCTRKLAAPRANGDLRNHRGNVTRDTLQGKLSASPTVQKGGADFRRAKDVPPPAREDSILVRLNRQTQ